ncbi:MAG: ribonuclease III [Bacteroides sp.]|nr:ribonuclease III [Prevotella sp.]MCM1408233.1 ribonuclease III [Treponema brennaborense]MCM1469557.1 ribonuclease III [Bacteroides sp.]
MPAQNQQIYLLSERKKQLNCFQKKNKIHFKDLNLLNLAFSHRSFANESAALLANNERLEFLGDAVLGMIVAAKLYQMLAPNHAEGDLARIKSIVVSEHSLADAADAMEIDKYLLLGKGEELSGGRSKKAILADAVEAVIGAYYLDSGYKEAERFVLSFMLPRITDVIDNNYIYDYKTILQEFVQKKYKECPKYELARMSGPDHDRTFWMTVVIRGVSYGPAQGKNKKSAEQAAAKYAWNEIANDKI